MNQFMPVQGIGNATVDRLPDTCPLCHRAMCPTSIGPGIPTREERMEVVFQCPSRECRKLLIGTYQRSLPAGIFSLVQVAPCAVSSLAFSAEIQGLSPPFVEIFNEARAAESYGLTHIAGAGYRKALEYLVKDFCASSCGDDTEKAEAIRSKYLGKVIGEDISDPRMRAAAQRATWLGNDETHYVRKWDEKDREDLKKLIALTVSWVNTNLLTDSYIDEMPSGR
jgi:hypothetical protein